MTLEHKLSNSAEAWLAEEMLSPAQSAALVALVRRRARARRLVQGVRATAAVAAVVCTVIFWPVLVSLASDLPVVGPLVMRWAGVDRGADWAAQNGYVVPVGKSASHKGYSLRVDSVLADAARTEVYYVIEGPGLQDAPPPVLDATYDRRTPSGGSGDASEIIDGRLVGTLSLPPLPRPSALVTVTAYEIAGVTGTWEVTFTASRAELDKQTRSVTVQTGGEPVQSAVPPLAETPVSAGASEGPDRVGVASESTAKPAMTGAQAVADTSVTVGALDVPGAPVPAHMLEEAETPPAGPITEVAVHADTTKLESECRLTLTRVLLAPTETVVEMRGPVVQYCDVREAELVTGGGHVNRLIGKSGGMGAYRFRFDRLEAEPAEVTLRLTRVVTWEPGGPVIDLTQTGVRTTYGQGWWFEPQTVRYESGRTVAVLKLGREAGSSAESEYFRRWAVVDAEGKRHRSVEITTYRPDADPANWYMDVTLEGEVTDLHLLESGVEAITVPGPFEVTIPLK